MLLKRSVYILIWLILAEATKEVKANHGNNVQKWSESAIVLHDDTDFGGKKTKLQTAVHNLDNHNFNDIVSSIKVTGEAWVLYEHSTFRGKRYVVNEGQYPHWNDWNGENDHISSVRPMSEEPKITLCDDTNFEGMERVILNEPVTRLRRLNRKVSSIKVEKGIWVLFEHANFQGKSYVLNEGYFPNWKYWKGNNDEISSLCPLNQCPFEDGTYGDTEDCDNSVNNCGLSTAAKVGIALGTGALAFFGAPVVLPYLGFTAAGIAGGSTAAGMMSSAATATGGGVAAGSTVAVLQSIGAAGGIGAAAVAMVTTATYASVEVASRAVCGLKEWTK